MSRIMDALKPEPERPCEARSAVFYRRPGVLLSFGFCRLNFEAHSCDKPMRVECGVEPETRNKDRNPFWRCDAGSDALRIEFAGRVLRVNCLSFRRGRGPYRWLPFPSPTRAVNQFLSAVGLAFLPASSLGRPVS